jgi:hypothetical protein
VVWSEISLAANQTMRTPEWWLKAFRFLATINPKKYRMEESQFMEGMISEFDLKEKVGEDFKEKIGPTVVRYHVSKRWHIRNQV